MGPEASAAGAAATAATATPKWSVGAGISGSMGEGSWAYAGTGDLHVSAGMASLVLFERRLGRGVFLMLEPEIYYRNELVDDIEEEDRKTGRLDVLTGVRWVANPGGVVEVGMAHLIDGSYRRATHTGEFYRQGNDEVESGQFWGTSTTNEYGIGLRNSLVAERELVDRLWLRVSASLLYLGYGTGDLELVYEADNLVEKDDVRVFAVGFVPIASLTLRLAF